MAKKPTSEKHPYTVAGIPCEHVLLVPNGTYRNDKGEDDKGRGRKESSHYRVFSTPTPKSINGEALVAAVNELNDRGDITTLDAWADALKQGLPLKYQKNVWSDVVVASDKVTDARIFKMVVMNPTVSEIFKTKGFAAAKEVAVEIIKESKGFIPRATDDDSNSYDLAKATWDQHE